MIRRVPRPTSGGLVLSYRCTSRCRHCIYACTPDWEGGWISREDLSSILETLSGEIVPAPGGPERVALNHGLHFTGGEPFANFELLREAVRTAEELKIPSTFVETNCFWATDPDRAREMLGLLKEDGLKGILISVNPFYLEYVPFERTENAIRASLGVFGENTFVYQLEYFRRFKKWGVRGSVPFEEYLTFEKREHVLQNVEFFLMGRAPYKLREFLTGYYPPCPSSAFFREPCVTPFLRPLHNHFDNFGNYVPGFCAGISLGDIRRLDWLATSGIDTEKRPVLKFLIDGDLSGLYRFAVDLGYGESFEGYLSRCHLCMDVRRHLVDAGDFPELSPAEFYRHLET